MRGEGGGGMTARPLRACVCARMRGCGCVGVGVGVGVGVRRWIGGWVGVRLSKLQ